MASSVVLRFVLMCGLCLGLSGCILNALLSRVTLGDEISFTIVGLQASTTVRSCNELAITLQGRPFQCTFVIGGQEGPSAFTFASEFGLFGAIIDPVILQVPVAATNFTGTFSGTTTSGNLTISVIAGSLDADVSTVIAPEPGTKLVVVDFPTSATQPGGAYGFNFGFQLPGVVNPVQVKALFAARVESGGRTFYPPLLPCETDFANVPVISMPLGPTFQAVNLTGSPGLVGCRGRVYQLSAASSATTTNEIPTLHPALLGVLALMVAWAGARLVRRH